MVKYWWSVLNIAVFRSKLSAPISIELIRHRKEYAWAFPKTAGKIKLTMQPHFSSRTLFLMVLVHEMVHAWEHFRHLNMTHGPKFTQWAPKIRKLTTLNLKRTLQDHDARIRP